MSYIGENTYAAWVFSPFHPTRQAGNVVAAAYGVTFMVFNNNGKEYAGATSVEVVREMERDADSYPHRGSSLREFLRWSLAGLADRVHMRELDLGAHLADETLAFSYLCLLERHGIGRLDDSPSDPALGNNTHAA